MAVAGNKACKSAFPTEASLIEGIRSGNEKAVGCLYRHLYAEGYLSIRKLIFFHNGSKADAEDLFQEAFLTFRRKILDGSFEYREGTKLSTYFYDIYKFKWMDEMKKISRQRMIKHRLDYELAKEEEPAEFDLIRDERARHLQEQIAKLGEKCAFILKKFIWHRWSLESIAESLSMEAASVKNQKYRCMKKLREMYAGQVSRS